MRRALALALFLAVGCGGQVEGGQVEREREAAPVCHPVRGYFADQRCSRGIEFDRCAPPAYAYAVKDFRCTLVRDP